MENEQEEEFMPVWMKTEEVRKLVEMQDEKEESYTGRFANRRDLGVVSEGEWMEVGL